MEGLRIPEHVERFYKTTGMGRRRLLVLTYEFSPREFESRFHARLYPQVQMDVIAGCLEGRPATGYNVWQSSWRGLFHAKAMILLANDAVQVGIGSANLTAGGMGDNLEAWRFYAADKAPSVAAGMRRFLQGLADRKLVPGLELEEFIHALPKLGAPSIHSSLDGPLLPQVEEALRGAEIRRLDIVSPLHGDPTAIVRKMKGIVGDRAVNLYTDSEPPPPRIPGIAEYWVLHKPEDEKETDEPSKRRRVACVHAKLYAFHLSREVRLFWGSANLSASAWLIPGRRSNLDLLAGARMSPTDWKRFLHALPEGHSWERIEPRGRPAREKVPQPDSAPILLHASWDRQELVLGSTASGSWRVALSATSCARPVLLKLVFNDGVAVLPRTNPACWSLGFGESSYPRYLLFRHRKAWREIPVNGPADCWPDGYDSSLASRLFWMFTGKNLPEPKHQRNHGPNGEDGSEEMLDAEEAELTRSAHQGRLDRLVLEWRLVIKGIRRSSGANKALLRYRTQEVLAAIAKEALRFPSRWPGCVREFIEERIRSPWQN